LGTVVAFKNHQEILWWLLEQLLKVQWIASCLNADIKAQKLYTGEAFLQWLRYPVMTGY